MRDSRREVLMAVAVALSTVGCEREATRLCPDGMAPVAGRSAAGRELWCRTNDGARLRWVAFYEGGQVRHHSCGFVGGRAEGAYQSWHPDGKPFLAGGYQGGKKSGKWTQWDGSGLKVADGEYRDGELVAGAPVGAIAPCEKVNP